MQQTLQILDATLAAAVAAETTTPVAMGPGQVLYLTLYASFVRAGGGTTAKAWVQTSLDGGTSWMDIANFAFTTSTANAVTTVAAASAAAITTPTDGTLADNTSTVGFLGALYRVKLTTTGTYTGASSFKIWATPK